MPQMKSESTEWAELLQQHLAEKRLLPEGEGWKTAKELEGVLGRGAAATQAFIRKETARGSLEVFRGTDFSASGEIHQQRWYRRKK